MAWALLHCSVGIRTWSFCRFRRSSSLRIVQQRKEDRKMSRGLTIALLVVMLVSLATCQTFQYSRGWTNGKRAETSPLAGVLDFKAGRMNDLEARCANLYKWKTLFRASDNEEVCRVPCEFVDVLRQCLHQDKAILNDLTDFRRSSAPALDTSSSLSY